MGKSMFNELKNMKDGKWLIRIIGLTALVTYGFFVTHSTVGIDDTAIERYFVDGWAPHVGRWSLFLLNKFFDFAHYTPWFMDVIGIMLLCVAAYLFCFLWYEISNKRAGILSMTAFSTIFITYPLIGEVYIYYLHNGISLAFVLMALAGLEWWKYLSGGSWKAIVKIALYLSIAVGCYESFVLVYMVLISGIYFGALYLDTLPQKKLGKWCKDIIFAVIPLVVSMGIRVIMYSAINAVIGMEANARNISALKLWFINNPIVLLKDIIYQFFIRYVLNGKYIFGIRVFLVTMIFFVIIVLLVGVKKKKFSVFIPGAIMLIVPWLLAAVELSVTSYRASQALMLMIALCWFWIFEIILSIQWKKGKKYIKTVLAILLIFIVFRQGYELHQYFYFDFIKSEHDQNFCRELAEEIVSNYDTSKPVIFIGQRKMPVAYREWVYLAPDSLEYKDITQKYNLLYIQAFYRYIDPELGYGIYEVANMDVIAWISWADLGDGEYEVYPYMKMLGYDFAMPTKELRQEVLAKSIEEGEYPIWPQEGAIVETDQYICVYLGKIEVFL